MSKKHRRLATELEEEIKIAASHYPDLAGYKIIFDYKKIGRQSFMLAQPRLRSLIFPKRKRQFEIHINDTYFTQNPHFDDGRVPSEVLIGWLGHELGHVQDYIRRSSVNLMWFGFMYYFYPRFIMKAEIFADRNAVKAGLIDYLVTSKEFGRNTKYFPQDYIDKLNKLYPSVQDVKDWDAMYKKREQG